MKVKAIIIGCGNIAGDYDNYSSSKIRTHAKAYLCNNKTDLLGVCDSNIKKASKFAKKWRVSYFTDSLDEILEVCKPDLVSICTNTESHFEISKKVIQFGVKHVWLEKPATINIKETKALYRLSQKHKTNVTVGYFRRHEIKVNSIKNQLSKFGKIQFINCYYTKGLENNGSHLIDLLINLFGNKLNIGNIIYIHDNKFPLVSFKAYGKSYEINIVALDYNYYEAFEIDIHFTKGRLIIADGGRNLYFYKIKKNKYYTNYSNLELSKKIEVSYNQTFKNMLSNILSNKKITSLKNEIEIYRLLEEIKKRYKVKKSR